MKNQAVVVVVAAAAAAVAALFWLDYFSLEFVSHETWNSDGSISLSLGWEDVKSHVPLKIEAKYSAWNRLGRIFTGEIMGTS